MRKKQQGRSCGVTASAVPVGKFSQSARLCNARQRIVGQEAGIDCDAAARAGRYPRRWKASARRGTCRDLNRVPEPAQDAPGHLPRNGPDAPAIEGGIGLRLVTAGIGRNSPRRIRTGPPNPSKASVFRPPGCGPSRASQPGVKDQAPLCQNVNRRETLQKTRTAGWARTPSNLAGGDSLRPLDHA